ncbi:fascin-3 isoform X2 [Pseudonaja textilis]|uniref:fascin-3 isoform X2 n=1 Tax=Pseudonaja textilis TaxID=8673 RepID=UPI000EA971EA|nr:fascin-3 isoform X2 [Pseudonaja textilis]
MGAQSQAGKGLALLSAGGGWERLLWAGSSGQLSLTLPFNTRPTRAGPPGRWGFARLLSRDGDWPLLLSQTWKLRVTTEQVGKRDVVALVGHQGQHLLVEADGTVRCGRPGAEKRSRFLLEVHPSGAWTLQQLESQKFLESDGEDVFCVARGLTAHHLWMPQLAEHVHVVLFNPSSQLYARTDPELNRVWVDAPVPYLEECGFLLRFRKGACHLETSTHQFVSRAEKLAAMPSAETAFHLNLKPGCLAFLTDRDGHVLYPQGSRGLLCLGDHPEENEEWFVIQRCPPWVSLGTRANRFISIISDSEVYAGPKKLSPMSTFLFEMDSHSQTVQIKGVHHKYLAQRPFQSVLANGAAKEAETRFQVLWHYGKVFLRAPRGRYLGTLPVGLLVARATHPGKEDRCLAGSPGLHTFASRSCVPWRGGGAEFGLGRPSFLPCPPNSLCSSSRATHTPLYPPPSAPWRSLAHPPQPPCTADSTPLALRIPRAPRVPPASPLTSCGELAGRCLA